MRATMSGAKNRSLGSMLRTAYFRGIFALETPNTEHYRPGAVFAGQPDRSFVWSLCRSWFAVLYGG